MVQKHIQRFVFNRLKYVVSASLFACHCAHCSFFFFFVPCSNQVGMIDICQVFFIFCQRRSKSGFSEVNICLLVKERCWLIELIHRKMMFPYLQSSSPNGLNRANLKIECSNKKTTNILYISKPCRMYSKYSLPFACQHCIRKLSYDPIVLRFLMWRLAQIAWDLSSMDTITQPAARKKCVCTHWVAVVSGGGCWVKSVVLKLLHYKPDCCGW